MNELGDVQVTPRKIVQIATIGGGDYIFPLVIALCSDGSLWTLTVGHASTDEWHALPAIPQGPVA